MHRRTLLATYLASLISFPAAAGGESPPHLQSSDTLAGSPRSAAEQIENCVTIVECVSSRGDKWSGTGFIYRFIASGTTGVDCLVTNRHILNDADVITIYFTEKSEIQTPSPRVIPFSIDGVQEKAVYHPDKDVDLVALPLSDVASQISQISVKLDVTSITQTNILKQSELSMLNPIEDVIIVGYPVGQRDKINNLPIFRKGITATAAYIKFEGKPFFLVDAGIFHGSSGSPVFLYNIGLYADRNGATVLGTRVKILGIISGVYSDAQSYNEKIAPGVMAEAVPIGLGICWMASLLFDLEATLVARYRIELPSGYVIRRQD